MKLRRVKRPPLTVWDRREIAAKAVATRRRREADMIAGRWIPEPIVAGRRQDYAALDTPTLLGLLPGEQAYLDRFLNGMQARFAKIRLRAIEEQLTARGVNDEIAVTWRFGYADAESELADVAERLAIASEPGDVSARFLDFDPSEFAA